MMSESVCAGPATSVRRSAVNQTRVRSPEPLPLDMRIVVRDTCNASFLDAHYANHGGLAGRAHTEEWRSITDTGFSTSAPSSRRRQTVPQARRHFLGGFSVLAKDLGRSTNPR